MRKAEVPNYVKDIVTVLQIKQRNLEKIISVSCKFYIVFILVLRAFDSRLSIKFGRTSIQTLSEEPVVKENTYTIEEQILIFEYKRGASQPACDKGMTTTSGNTVACRLRQ